MAGPSEALTLPGHPDLRRFVCALVLTGSAAIGVAGVQAPEACDAPAREAVTHVDVPGNPFLALPSRDGCWIYVSLLASADAPGRVALFRRMARHVSFVRSVEAGSPGGMVLTNDQKLLIVAAGATVAFIDTARFASGDGNALLGQWTDELPSPGRIYANVTGDDASRKGPRTPIRRRPITRAAPSLSWTWRAPRFAGSADDRQSLTIIDAGRVKEGAAAVVGSIPAGGFPREMRVTGDGRTLLLTNFRSRTLQIVDLARLPSR